MENKIPSDTYWKNMYPEVQSQFSRISTRIKPGPGTLVESRSVMTFLTIFKVKVILWSLSIILERKAGRDIRCREKHLKTNNIEEKWHIFFSWKHHWHFMKSCETKFAGDKTPSPYQVYEHFINVSNSKKSQRENKIKLKITGNLVIYSIFRSQIGFMRIVFCIWLEFSWN